MPRLLIKRPAMRTVIFENFRALVRYLVFGQQERVLTRCLQLCQLLAADAELVIQLLLFRPI
jgi:hypothetical protein